MFQKEKSQTSNPIIKEREKKGGVPIASEKPMENTVLGPILSKEAPELTRFFFVPRRVQHGCPSLHHVASHFPKTPVHPVNLWSGR